MNTTTTLRRDQIVRLKNSYTNPWGRLFKAKTKLRILAIDCSGTYLLVTTNLRSQARWGSTWSTNISEIEPLV